MAGDLDVLVINAENLKNVESFGRMDPFVVLELSGQKFQTKSKTDAGKRPQFNERFSFLNIDTTYATELTVKVADHNTITSDTEIGVGRVPLSRVYQQTGAAVETRVSLTTAKGKSAGELLLLLTFKPHAPAAPAPVTPTTAVAPLPAAYALSPPPAVGGATATPMQPPVMVAAPAQALPVVAAPPPVQQAQAAAPAYWTPQQQAPQHPHPQQQERYVAPASIAFPETSDYTHSSNTYNYRAGTQTMQQQFAAPVPPMAQSPAAPYGPPMVQPPAGAYTPPAAQPPMPAHYTQPATQGPPMPAYAPPMMQPAAPAYAQPLQQPPVYFPPAQPIMLPPMPTYPQPPAYPGVNLQGAAWPPAYPSSDVTSF